MAKIKFILDPFANTLNIWWDTPKKDDYSEESKKSNDVIIYSRDGFPKGVEIIGLFPQELSITKRIGKNKIQEYIDLPIEVTSYLRDKERK